MTPRSRATFATIGLALSLVLLVARAQSKPEPISPDNVGRLGVAWTYDTREPIEPMPGHSKRPALEATPVYKDGRLYFSTPRGAVIALDANTGAEIWRVELEVRRDANYSEFTSRGLALRDDRLFIGTIDARLVCLERETGQRCKAFGRNGEIDLTEGLRRMPGYPGEYGVSSPPAIYRDLVIVGSFVADNSRARMASGEVRAFDSRTGALRWTFHPLPADAAAGGANTWSLMAVDEANGLVFLPTGSASPDYFGGLRPGANGYANSIVALRAATGEVAWHFQTVHHDLWDYDVASPPVLFEAKSGPAVAAGSKTGHLFLFNRLTGKPLFAIEERKVPASDVEGEQASPTQPFPTAPPALAPQQVREDELWGRTPADLEACRATLRTLRNDGVFTPPSVRGSVHVPGNIGGLHWGGAAWDPPAGCSSRPSTACRQSSDCCRAPGSTSSGAHTPNAKRPSRTGRRIHVEAVLSLAVRAAVRGAAVGRAGRGQCRHRMDRLADDVGDLRERFELTLPTATGAPSLGGPVTTGTGLVFIGATLNPYFRAFDTRDGREVWKARLPTSARATPLLYTTESGRQMVVITAGGHDSPLSRLDTKIVAFGLR